MKKYKIFYLIFFIIPLLGVGQTNANITKIKYYLETSENCEIEAIPLYCDSIFRLLKELKTHNYSNLKEIEQYEATAYNNLGFFFHENNLVDKALPNYKIALYFSEKWKDTSGIAQAFNNIGMIYKDKSDVKNAVEYITEGIRYNEILNNFSSVSTGYNNIGTLYFRQGDVDLALINYTKALKFAEKDNSKKEIAYSLNNMASCYVEKQKYQEALVFFYRSLELRKQLKNISCVTNYNNIAFMYRRLNQYDKALEFYRLALNDQPASSKNSGLAASNLGIANVLIDQGEIYESLPYAIKAYELYTELNLNENIGNAAQALYTIYAKKKQFEKAYYYLNESINMYKETVNDENKKTIYKKEVQFEYQKKSFTDSLKSSEEKTQRFALYGGLVLVIVFGVFVFNRLKITQKQKTIIELKEKETQYQKHLVDEKQKEILDSITYAKRLQEAILPPTNLLKKHLPEHFILYKPKDIVAGDFYWFEKKGDLLLIAAADSTGHGVPGAMVSLVCSNALHRSVNEFGMTDTGKILDKTRELVLETFAKSESEVKDGMDISLLSINTVTKELKWSGAHNSLCFIHNKELKEIKAHKQSIGKVDNPTPFTTHIVEAQGACMIYLLTDGYADQFGGQKGKKFKYKQLEELLLANCQLSMSEQITSLQNVFDEWKGTLEQVDDVTIIGIRV